MKRVVYKGYEIFPEEPSELMICDFLVTQKGVVETLYRIRKVNTSQNCQQFACSSVEAAKNCIDILAILEDNPCLTREQIGEVLKEHLTPSAEPNVLKDFVGPNITRAVFDLLDRKSLISASDVVEHIWKCQKIKAKTSSVYSVLSAQSQRGKIVRCGRGTYRKPTGRK